MSIPDQGDLVETLLNQSFKGQEGMRAVAAKEIVRLRNCVAELESDVLRRHNDACNRWMTIKEIELISDKCVNAEIYTAEDVLNDLQSIRRVIALQPKEPK